MKSRCVCVAIVLAVSLLRSSVGAEELGFPKRCVELQNFPRQGFYPEETFSSKLAVLFHVELASRQAGNGLSQSFLSWDSDTGKWLGRRSIPNARLGHWTISPDGTVMAVPLTGQRRDIQLWEVGSKDRQGVPQLRLIAELRRPTKPTPAEAKLGRDADALLPLAWTPDGKTLIAAYLRKWYDFEILFWSFTDKPSVEPDDDQDDRGAKRWKPWAKLEIDAHVAFAVSPDNQTLAVTEDRLDSIGGEFFDLKTAQPRGKFQIDHPRINAAAAAKIKSAVESVRVENLTPRFSPDSKTLAIIGDFYFALWDTEPPAPRFEMIAPDFNQILGNHQTFAFTPDSRWLLTRTIAENNDVLRRQGGFVQVRDMQTGKVHRESSFPEKLGLLFATDALPDDRILTRFQSRSGVRHFLWHADDLLRYAVEHSTPPR